MTFRLRFGLIAATFVLVISGCGSHGSGEPPGPGATVDPATAGSLSGTVTVAGPLPDSNPIDMSASPACMQANPTAVMPPTVVKGDNGALANVVVYIKSGLGNYRYDSPSDTAVLYQKNCMYEPHVVALMTNQPFAVQNNDPTLHNVHPMPKHNRQWSNSQPAGSAPLKQSFANPEFAMPVLCNVHPWMRAFVFVFDHPYFAVTSETGTFELKHLPPGTYTIEAWHESYAAQDQTVTVGPKESKSVAFTFTSSSQANN
jgi:Carboxypeptidase regulatory-like domain